jgi:hypothetical protein
MVREKTGRNDSMFYASEHIHTTNLAVEYAKREKALM